MIERPIWTERLRAAWKQASIVWLTGPRRVGKTVLAKSLPDAEFLNCDLPSVEERLRDPEKFLPFRDEAVGGVRRGASASRPEPAVEDWRGRFSQVEDPG